MKKVFKVFGTILGVGVLSVGIAGIVKTILNFKHAKDYYNKCI